MAAHPTNIWFSCSYNSSNVNDTVDGQAAGLPWGFVTMKNIHDLDPLVKGKLCSSWNDNEVAESGYGSVVASRVFRAEATYETLNGQESPGRAVLMRNQSIPRLSPIQITLYDGFNQWPAEGRVHNREVFVTLLTEEESTVELSGQLSIPFIRGEAVLDDVIVRGPPGNHSLMLEFSDSVIGSVNVEMEILPCPVGWESVANDSACERCQEETYNFDSEGGTCRDCPSNGRCRFWGIEPRKNYWQPFPCYDDPVECLSENSCDFGR